MFEQKWNQKESLEIRALHRPKLPKSEQSKKDLKWVETGSMRKAKEPKKVRKRNQKGIKTDQIGTKIG